MKGQTKLKENKGMIAKGNAMVLQVLEYFSH